MARPEKHDEPKHDEPKNPFPAAPPVEEDPRQVIVRRSRIDWVGFASVEEAYGFSLLHVTNPRIMEDLRGHFREHGLIPAEAPRAQQPMTPGAVPGAMR